MIRDRFNRYRMLELLSSRLFMAGLFLSKFSRLRVPFISSVSLLSSALCYFLGYCTWQASAYENTQIKDELQGELQQKFIEANQHIFQYQLAAILGIVASLMLISTLLFPLGGSYGILCSWVFFSSNVFWLWGENIVINRSRQQALDESSSLAKESYYRYAITATLISAFTSIGLTSSALMPMLAIPAASIGFPILLMALNVLALYHWCISAYERSEPSDETEYELQPNSYRDILTTDEPNMSPQRVKVVIPSAVEVLDATEEKTASSNIIEPSLSNASDLTQNSSRCLKFI